MNQPKIWINCFEVPDGQQDEFFEYWHTKAAAYFRVQPGFIDYQMFRATEGDKRIQFVNFARWESEEHQKAAHTEQFFELLKDPRNKNVRATPAFFELVAEGPALEA